MLLCISLKFIIKILLKKTEQNIVSYNSYRHSTLNEVYKSYLKLFSNNKLLQLETPEKIINILLTEEIIKNIRLIYSDLVEPINNTNSLIKNTNNIQFKLTIKNLQREGLYFNKYYGN